MTVGLRAAVLTIGTELVSGERLDTNSATIARSLLLAGYRVTLMLTLPDDEAAIAEALRRIVMTHPLVVVTGGLGPTHDDVTRAAASSALGRRLVRDPGLAITLGAAAARHRDPEAADQVLRQADVIEGARILPAVIGTAPGQVVPTPAGTLVLLPGPPRELAPLLDAFLAETRSSVSPPVRLRCTDVTESDAQVTVARVLKDLAGVGLTVLAAPGEVEVVLFDTGAGARTLHAAAQAATHALGVACYSSDGSSLAETVVRLARQGSATLAVAESCTGGMLAAEITAVPGASDVFVGGVVAYANSVKLDVLDVGEETLRRCGAVSGEVAEAMAAGVAARLGASHAVAVTGIAGPDGGTDDRPIGLVWFGLFADESLSSVQRRFTGDRHAVRLRATATALDLLRRALAGA